jgi:hypothetical protein
MPGQKPGIGDSRGWCAPSACWRRGANFESRTPTAPFRHTPTVTCRELLCPCHSRFERLRQRDGCANSCAPTGVPDEDVHAGIDARDQRAFHRAGSGAWWLAADGRTVLSLPQLLRTMRRLVGGRPATTGTACRAALQAAAARQLTFRSGACLRFVALSAVYHSWIRWDQLGRVRWRSA